MKKIKLMMESEDAQARLVIAGFTVMFALVFIFCF